MPSTRPVICGSEKATSAFGPGVRAGAAGGACPAATVSVASRTLTKGSMGIILGGCGHLDNAGHPTPVPDGHRDGGTDPAVNQGLSRHRGTVIRCGTRLAHSAGMRGRLVGFVAIAA